MRLNVVQYLRDVVQEVTKVSWPPVRTVAIHTLIVIMAMVAIVTIVGAVDSLLVLIIRKGILQG